MTGSMTSPCTLLQIEPLAFPTGFLYHINVQKHISKPQTPWPSRPRALYCTRFYPKPCGRRDAPETSVLDFKPGHTHKNSSPDSVGAIITSHINDPLPLWSWIHMSVVSNEVPFLSLESFSASPQELFNRFTSNSSSKQQLYTGNNSLRPFISLFHVLIWAQWRALVR